MRINTNMAALNAWRSMETNQNNLQRSLGRLSSGYRINTAADDAAGLAVSEKMTAQIRGINMAVRNAQDASSMVQTAEGGAGNIQDMLQRMRELAVQAGSDTLQDSDRATLQKEFSELYSEIDRTSNTLSFNGRKLLNGASGTSIAANNTNVTAVRTTGDLDQSVATTYNVTINAQAKDELKGSVALKSGGVAKVDFSGGAAIQLDQAFGLDGVLTGSVTFTQGTQSFTINMTNYNGTETVQKFIDDVNNAAAANSMTMRLSFTGNDANGHGILIDANNGGSTGGVSVTENGLASSSSFGFTTGAGGGQLGADADIAIAGLSAGVDYKIAGNVVTGVQGRTFQNITFKANAPGVVTSTLAITKNSVQFQVGPDASETINADLGNLSASNLGLVGLKIDSRTNANTAIDSLDSALGTVNVTRATMGAMSNRLDNAISSLQTQSENLTAANSRIRDVDMAAEMATFTKYQVLSQASTAMLAQANQLGQGILSLLR